MVFIISFIQTFFIGLIDALIKGNVIVHYEAWQAVPWYFKDKNFVYPGAIAFISAIVGVFIARKLKFGTTKYLIFLGIWGLSALESLSYWFWIMVLKIGQQMPWLPDSSIFWWYPKQAPWLNIFPHLKAFSGGGNVTRTGVLLAILLAIVLNLVLSFVWRKTRKAKTTIC